MGSRNNKHQRAKPQKLPYLPFPIYTTTGDFDDDFNDDMDKNASLPYFELGSSDSLKSKGIYYITGVIDTNDLIHIHQDIIVKSFDSKWNGEIQLVINSLGGSTAEVWALIDILKWSNFTVRTIGMGCCASMGAILVACGTPGKRIIAPNTTLMIHQYSWFVGGKHCELIAQEKGMMIEQERHIKFWIDHSKYKTAEEVEKYLLQKTDNYLSPEEALEHGIVDSIASNPTKKQEDEIVILGTEAIVKPKKARKSKNNE